MVAQSVLGKFAQIGLIATLMLLTNAGEAQESKKAMRELSFNLVIPPVRYRWPAVLEPWTKEVEKRTGGRIKIVPYFSATLSSPQGNFESVITGTADLAEGFPGLTPGRFPIFEIMGTTANTRLTSKHSSRHLMQVYKKFPAFQKELAEVKVMWLHMSDWTGIGFRGEKTNLSDFKGLKLFAFTRTMGEKFRALGANPVSMPPGDVYLSLQTGVLDGAVSNPGLLVGRKWGEVMKTQVIGFNLHQEPFYVVMNSDIWNRLPPDIQKILDQINEEMPDKMDEAAWGSLGLKHDYKLSLDMGVRFHRLPNEAIDKIARLTDEVNKEMVARVDKRGLPGTAIRNAFLELEQKNALPLEEWLPEVTPK